MAGPYDRGDIADDDTALGSRNLENIKDMDMGATKKVPSIQTLCEHGVFEFSFFIDIDAGFISYPFRFDPAKIEFAV